MNSPNNISKKLKSPRKPRKQVEPEGGNSSFVNWAILFTLCPIFFLISGMFYYEAYFKELGISSDMVGWHWETTTLRGGILSMSLVIWTFLALILIRGLRKYTSVESVILRKINNPLVLILLPIILCALLLQGMSVAWNQHGEKGQVDARKKLANPTKIIYSLKGSEVDRKEADVLYKSSTDVVCLRSLDDSGKFYIHYYSFSDFSYYEPVNDRLN
ncbi:MAG: hypothetical protein ACSHXL_01000 [Bacteroidota bacterium]